jgi:hypothetical protein
MGHNNKLPFIIEAFEEYQSLYKKTFDVLQFNPSQMDEVIDLIRKDQQKTIVLLLSDESSDVDSLDANVLNNLLNVQTELKREDVEIIVELLDPNNDVIIQDFDIHNTIISNKIISLLLSKLALFPETALFYEQLLSFEITNAYQSDYEIVIYDASDLIQESLPKTFDSALELTYTLYDGFNAKTIPLGIHHEGELMILSDYLEHNTSMTIHQADEVICMNLTKKTQ